MKAFRLSLVAAALIFVVLAAAACDCTWSAHVTAWVDADRDGQRDAGEEPLRGVVFHVLYEGTPTSTHGVTGINGQLDIPSFMTGCEMTYQIVPEVPTGYTLTTPASLSVSNSSGSNHDVAFGFTYAPGVTPTPRPPSDLQCVVYTVRRPEGALNVEITDIAPQADGSVWITANYLGDGWTAHVPAGQAPGDVILDQLPLGGDFRDAEAVIVSQAGVPWFATGAGLLELAGATWITHTIALPDFRPGQLYDVAEQPDGTLWVTSSSGIAQFDPRAQTWQAVYHPTPFQLRQSEWLGRATDDSLRAAVFRYDDLVLVGRDAVGMPITATVTSPGMRVKAAAMTPEGVWWFGGPPNAPGSVSEGLDSLVRLDPDGEWTRYTYSSTAGGLTGDAILALAALPDGLLVGTARSGLLRRSDALRARPKDSQWRSYTMEDGLPGDSITGIAVESARSVWLSACDLRSEDCPATVDRSGVFTANLLARCRFE